MEDVSKYIGITHKFNGRTRNGCDCLGLCALFYEEHNWIKLDDGKPITEDWEDKDPYRLVRWFSKRFEIIRNPDKLEFGDILLFDIYGDAHIALYLEYGRILSMQVPVEEGKTKSTIYHRDIWEKGFKVGFKRARLKIT